MISGYTAWSVVAFEVPTTAKWNYLGSNDAAFYSSIVALESGWIDADITWTYASATTHTNTNTVYSGTFTLSGDQTTRYRPGTRLKFIQSGTTKYAVVVTSSYGAPNTTVKIYLGTDYQLTNVAITSPQYSYEKSPAQFPCDRSKWDTYIEISTDSSQASPTANTWYNASSINIPIGEWGIGHRSIGKVRSSGAATNVYMQTTLSTANNTESNANFSTYLGTVGTSANPMEADGVLDVHNKNLALTVATTYYLNMMTPTSSIANINLLGTKGWTTIYARFNYL